MSLKGIRNAYQQAKEIYKLEQSSIKALGFFFKALWLGKQVVVKQPGEQKVGNISSERQTGKLLDQRTVKSTTGIPVVKLYGNQTSPHKGSVKESDDTGEYDQQQKLQEKDHEQNELRSTIKVSKGKSRKVRKKVSFADMGTATHGSVEELKENTETVVARKNPDGDNSRKTSPQPFNLSANERENLLGWLENNGADGFREYLGDSVYMGSSRESDKLQDYRDFFLSEDKFTDEVEDVWIEKVGQAFARESLSDLRDGILYNFENNLSLSREALTAEFELFEQRSGERVEEVEAKLKELEPALSAQAYEKALQHATEEIKTGFRSDRENLDELWDVIRQKRDSNASSRTDSSYMRFAEIKRKLKDRKITISEARKLRNESERKLTNLNKKHGVNIKYRHTPR